MPLTSQITNTAVDITPTTFVISAASSNYSPTTPIVTYTATGHTFTTGSLITVTGLSPDAYNYTDNPNSVATNQFTFNITVSAPLLSATNGIAVQTPFTTALADNPTIYGVDKVSTLPTGNIVDPITGITHSTLLDLEANSLALSAAFASTNIDAKTSGVAWFTSNASSTGYINIRGDSSTTLDSYMKVNDTLSLSVCVTNGGTAYYINAVKIDGTTQTVKWIGGNAPSAGNASAVDLYTFSILKTASATFTVIGNMASAS